MRILLTFLVGILASQAKPTQPNVLLICVDDLRPELKCYGMDYIKSPHIDRLAETGRIFTHHYVQAPTCGASRFSLLTGCYDRQFLGNTALFERAKKLADPPAQPSMPRHFRDHGYTTVSVGKVSHHPGGRGGKNWDDDATPEIPKAWSKHLQPVGPWEHPRGLMHGLANGASRDNTKKLASHEAFDGPDTSYPDGLTTDAAVAELKQLAEADEPFFLAVGIIRPHLPFGAPKRYLDLYKDTELPSIPHPEKPSGKTTWHASGEFTKQYDHQGKDPNKDPEYATTLRRHYAACVTYADAQVGRLLETLEASGKGENTIIVLWGDHGWHLGEHAIWGKHALFEESLRSPLIVSYPGIKDPGGTSDAVVETVDIFPSLCEISKLETPGNLDGKSLKPQLAAPDAPGSAAISYFRKASSIRTKDHRLIAHPNGFLELYDHRTEDAETKNIAEAHPEITRSLKQRLEAALK